MECRIFAVALARSSTRRLAARHSPAAGVVATRPTATITGITATTGLRQRPILGIHAPRHSHPSARRFLQTKAGSASTASQPASQLNHDIQPEEQSHYDRRLAQEARQRQIRTPWHREGSDQPPVEKQAGNADSESAGEPASSPGRGSAMTKGKLLTTPGRMLKLILPLTTINSSKDGKGAESDVEPLALLVHPQQPLSYLERLLQSELPMIEDKDGRQKVPQVYFRAEDTLQDSLEPRKPLESSDSDGAAANDEANQQDLQENADETMIDGEAAKTGVLNSKKTNSTRHRPEDETASALRGGPGQGGVERYSGLGQDAKGDPGDKARHFVRWSSSTDIGDFIRDAARGQEFAVEIEGAPRLIYVGVPSFKDRTYYLRMRLRKKSADISSLAKIKEECDRLAQRSAQRIAMLGLGALVAWWGTVYRLTFQTDLGWDVMEPITYLVSLTTIMGGYTWFLYHNREVSYRSAMNFTISRRQSRLYEQKGFDLSRWQGLVEDANALRREIMAVATEYDVEWDERRDELDQSVMDALRKERKEEKRKEKDKDEDGDDTGESETKSKEKEEGKKKKE